MEALAFTSLLPHHYISLSCTNQQSSPPCRMAGLDRPTCERNEAVVQTMSLTMHDVLSVDGTIVL